MSTTPHPVNTSTDVTVRRAVPEDFTAIAALTQNAYLEGGHLTPQDTYLPYLADVAHRHARGELYVAEAVAAGESAPRVAGSVLITPHGTPMAETSRPDELEFRMLAVDPDFQGRGVGRTLVRFVIDRARAEPGVNAVVLTTMDTMTTAHRLYRSEGFEHIPERDWSISDVDPEIDPAEDKGPFPVYRRPL